MDGKRQLMTDHCLQMRKWRNWQTHQLEGLTLARAWGFESPLPHHLINNRLPPRVNSHSFHLVQKVPVRFNVLGLFRFGQRNRLARSMF
jgi:hypothetical protein